MQLECPVLFVPLQQSESADKAVLEYVRTRISREMWGSLLHGAPAWLVLDLQAMVHGCLEPGDTVTIKRGSDYTTVELVREGLKEPVRAPY